jgi:hypothetical protein
MAEKFAEDLSRRLRSDVWYVISRRHSIQYTDGVRQGEECEYDNLPRMYLKNHPDRPFLLSFTKKTHFVARLLSFVQWCDER